MPNGDEMQVALTGSMKPLSDDATCATLGGMRTSGRAIHDAFAQTEPGDISAATTANPAATPNFNAKLA